MSTTRAVNIFSAVSPVEYGQTIPQIAEVLRQKTIDTLTQTPSKRDVIVKGDDGHLYTFTIKVVPVRLGKADAKAAILKACPYVFIGQKTGVTEETLFDANAEAKYVKTFLVCVAKNADEALEGKYTIVAQRQIRHYAIKYANEHLDARFDNSYQCRPL